MRNSPCAAKCLATMMMRMVSLGRSERIQNIVSFTTAANYPLDARARGRRSGRACTRRVSGDYSGTTRRVTNESTAATVYTTGAVHFAHEIEYGGKRQRHGRRCSRSPCQNHMFSRHHRSPLFLPRRIRSSEGESRRARPTRRRTLLCTTTTRLPSVLPATHRHRHTPPPASTFTI